ncbi:thiamine pyrophosphate-binding protein [Pseudoduganella namucuonensis]|uniref:Acetolactate synthase-1/2/3 large subunit n=1 Tax=Pseudoduganella namucuonensis TaxID=1035707 RepID=A0A1I7HFI2_9BURK|nr:thiamine pyrophosphate-binding protein [Pseudoduganella namucuonensis]SFU59216.1 acetolactate synthase-1/2/3 large subunit [Pseudoduganella namucuonensis]
MFENVEFEQRHEQSSQPRATAPMPPEHEMDMADLLVAYLEQMGVEYVFGVPGGAIEPLYNAIARNQRKGGNLSHILARHEAGAAFMADGYARETGKIGVCISTSGPGATNMLTAVATAYSNDVPMLVITGQPALPSFGKHSLQESACTGVDVLGMFRHCTRYNSLVSHPQQLEWKLITALQHATRSPAGPVHLSVPMDVFRAPSSQQAPSYDMSNLLRPAALVDHGAIETLRGMLSMARNVVILVGGGCGNSIHSILQFASLKGATFVTTPDGKGLVSPQHPLYRGVFGFGGHATAEAALNDPSVDLIVAVGTSMGEWNTGGWNASLLNERLVHIDESEEHLARTPMARYHLRGSLSAIFDRLVERMHELGQHTDPIVERRRAARDEAARTWLPSDTLEAPDTFHSDATPIKPQRLMKELGELFPPSTRFLADTGNSIAWATHYLQPRDRRMGERRFGGGERSRDLGKRQSTGGWLRLTTHFAAMGWAIGAAIGTAAANPDVPVVCITGDGSMLMSGQELSVAVAEQQCVIFVVLNDRALGMIKHGQRLCGAEQIGFALPPTDFAAISRALGGRGYTIRSAADMQALDIKSICTYPGPTLLDVYIDPEEVPPMGSRLRVLQEGV